MWARLRSWQQSFVSFVRQETFLNLLLLLLLVLCLGTAGLTYFETVSPANALWWTLVTITTVGYGDIAPVTPGGRLIGVLTMLSGIGLLGTLSAMLASIMVSAKWRRLRGMGPLTCSSHFVICGWNYKAQEILRELRGDRDTQHTSIVLIADLPEQPIDLHDFAFVRGEVNMDTLAQANLSTARAAIVLSDEHVDAFSRDARAILTTLAIKKAYPTLYTCVELADPHNATHCKLAGADEIIVSGALTSRLLVQATLNPGVTQVISELLSYQEGQELYVIPAPTPLIGTTFLDAMTRLKQHHDALLVALQRGDEQAETNPAATYAIQKKDRLFVVSADRPHLS